MRVGGLGRGYVYVVEAKTRHKPYIVVHTESAGWACACPATTVCKHIRAVREVGPKVFGSGHLDSNVKLDKRVTGEE